MIYVLNSKGEPLMPTVRHGRVRHLLRDKKAFIVNYHPFTVQLTKERSNEIQEVSLGIDTGYENVGLSAANYPLPRSVFLFSADQFSTLSRSPDLLHSDHSFFSF